ncbi:asparaginase domain-containing protein [Marinobacter sp. M3C]|uniref:asparaginase domain-containing protein n=1 Tax=Marinobacter sp. M3C TaxID=2917715 RepID=UPI00200CEEA4|nr:asparaginase domain-containing protein [Marinobacter sp. M3C]UQG60848.1 asparaginase domain-containing protein [Marinobacter sp. M3C]
MKAEVLSILQKPSNAITQADLIEIQRLCQHLAGDPNVAGTVITHGADTLEEAAHFLDITLPLDHCALVVTGSPLTPHEEGTDGYRNIANAIIVAAHPATQGLVALMVFNESIYAAQHVRDVNTYQVNAFEPPGYGRLGYVNGIRAHLAQRTVRTKTLTLGESLPRVDILPAYLDASSNLFVKMAISKMSLQEVLKPSPLLTGLMLLSLVIITYVPWLSTYLLSLIYQ